MLCLNAIKCKNILFLVLSWLRGDLNVIFVLLLTFLIMGSVVRGRSLRDLRHLSSINLLLCQFLM